MIKKFRSSIIYKFMSIPILAALGFAIFILISLVTNRENADRLTTIKDYYIPILEKANHNVIRMEQISEKMVAYVTTADNSLIEEVSKISGEFNSSLDEIIDKSNQQYGEKSAVNEIKKIKKQLLEYMEMADAISKKIINQENLKSNSDYVNIYADAQQMNVKLTSIKESLSQFRKKYKQKLQNMMKMADKKASQAIDLGGAIGIFTVIVIFAVGFSITLMIARNINNVVQSFKMMERGEGVLTRVIECNSNDEVGNLVSSFNGFIGQLRKIISVVENQKEEIETLNSSLEDKVQELHILATTDKLTGMKNFAYFQEEIFKRVNEYKRTKGQLFLSLVIFDIDHFKMFNDTYGHLSGNIALKDVAGRISKHARKMDTPCRYGGEEFVVVLPKCNLDGARGFAERVRAEIENTPVKTEEHTVDVSVSAGCAEYSPEESIEHFIHRADEALYMAKENGRNRVELSMPENA
ncbi:MAG: diguanylate cyclase [Gammaproteobacteria bacterium]|nr:MAG: diguanylate cyclase [Gammaproteobacteria bacterium]